MSGGGSHAVLPPVVPPPRASPGVVEAVPLAGDGALAVGGVVSPHGGARVVGDGVEVVNGVVCGRRGRCSAGLPPPRGLRPPPQTSAPSQGPLRARPRHSLQLCEANSRRSRSFSWKLTKVVSLLARILASEKRFRSWGGGHVKEVGSQRGAPPKSPLPPPASPHPGPAAQRIRSTRILGNFWMLNFFVHLVLALQRQHVCGQQTTRAAG